MNKATSLDPNSYYYLWHLDKIGVIKCTKNKDDICPKVTNTLWDDIEKIPGSKKRLRPSRVALIDVGVSKSHSKLKGQISKHSLDLASNRYGVKYVKPGKNDSLPRKDKLFGALDNKGKLGKELLISDKSKFFLTDSVDKQFYDAIVDELVDSEGTVLNDYDDPDESFGSHGTAIAGLIVGNTDIEKNSTSLDSLPYFGVNPFAELISVRTSFDSDPFQFIAAFLYAWSLDVDVIVLPRGIPDPERSLLEPKKFEAKSETGPEIHEVKDLVKLIEKYQATQARDPKMPYRGSIQGRGWNVLEQLILSISQYIPVVCAAGNDGESQLIYPANLAGKSGGNGIVSVGSVSNEGRRSGYSNYGEGLTLVAPSDDIEIYNRHQRRTGETKDIVDSQPKSALPPVPYSDQGLLTSDLPGPYGYEEGLSSKGGDYTIFGGTSGACALVGGVISLMQTTRRVSKKDPLDGAQAKELLEKSAKPELLKVDKMNLLENKKPRFYYFGHGLVDARSAFDEVLNIK